MSDFVPEYEEDGYVYAPPDPMRHLSREGALNLAAAFAFEAGMREAERDRVTAAAIWVLQVMQTVDDTTTLSPAADAAVNGLEATCIFEEDWTHAAIREAIKNERTRASNLAFCTLPGFDKFGARTILELCSDITSGKES